MKRALIQTLALLFITFFASTAFAQRGNANTAREEARASAEAQARVELESLLGRLCPGRCELVELKAVVAEPRQVGQVLPGFEGSPGALFDAEVRRLEATILMDSTLPENFRTNIPRMAQFRLQSLAPTIIITPEFLEFPQPQLPPMPEALPSPPPQPRPLPEPVALPEPTDVQPAQAPEDPAPAEPTQDETPSWQLFLPWIALLLTLLILGGLIIILLRRLEALAKHQPTPAVAHDDQPPAAPTEQPARMPDIEALRAELTGSRSILNKMLRRWLDEDPKELAQLIRLIGPDILSDLRRDPEIHPALKVLSQEIGLLHQALDARQAQEIAEKARARQAAQLVIDDDTAEDGWDFLEGLNLGQIGTLLENTSQKERGFVLARLSPVLRSRYLESLTPDARRRLLLEASQADSISRTDARKLARRLREIADEFIDAGREAHGQATLIIEMLQAMTLHEQENILRDLQQTRQDVAAAALSAICLESAIPHLPDTALANAIHRIPLQTLTTFLQGTGRHIKDHVLNLAPGARRQTLAAELSLELPSTRADFLEARKVFNDALLATLRRDGFEIATFNTNALRRSAHGRSSPSSEAAE